MQGRAIARRMPLRCVQDIQLSVGVQLSAHAANGARGAQLSLERVPRTYAFTVPKRSLREFGVLRMT